MIYVDSQKAHSCNDESNILFSTTISSMKHYITTNYLVDNLNSKPFLYIDQFQIEESTEIFV